MDFNKAYETLDFISQKNSVDSSDLKTLIHLSQYNDSEIRTYVAELLVLSREPEAEMKLIDMCNDEDELVRVNACDSLSTFAAVNVFNKLVKCVQEDSSLLVKNYALLSIIDIMNCIDIDREKLKNLFLNTSQIKEVSILAACFKGLYILGELGYLKKIIGLLHAENYQDRCAVVNILGDMVTEENKDTIFSALKKIKATEKSDAVKSTIDEIFGV